MRASMGRFCVLSAFFLWGTVPAAALDSSALVTSMQNNYYGATGIDTIAGTIARDGTTSVSGTAGVDANATIHIGSQSKMFTSTVLLKLIDDHGLSLDDRLSDVAAKASLSDSAKLTALIASLPVEARSYTLRDFLSMGTALPNFMAGTPAGQNQTLWDLWKAANYGAVAGFNSPSSHQSLVDLAGQSFPGNPPPGFRYFYSNTNAVVLALMAEAVTGETFDSLIAKMTGDLGLSQTYLQMVAGSTGNIGTETGVKVANLDPTIPWTSGAMVTTMASLLKFLRIEITNDGSYLSDALFRARTDSDNQHTITMSGMPISYGLGLMTLDWKTMLGSMGLGDFAADVTSTGHGGSIAGASSFSGWLSSSAGLDLGFAVYANSLSTIDSGGFYTGTPSEALFVSTVEHLYRNARANGSSDGLGGYSHGSTGGYVTQSAYSGALTFTNPQTPGFIAYLDLTTNPNMPLRVTLDPTYSYYSARTASDSGEEVALSVGSGQTVNLPAYVRIEGYGGIQSGTDAFVLLDIASGADMGASTLAGEIAAYGRNAVALRTAADLTLASTSQVFSKGIDGTALFVSGGAQVTVNSANGGFFGNMAGIQSEGARGAAIRATGSGTGVTIAPGATVAAVSYGYAMQSDFTTETDPYALAIYGAKAQSGAELVIDGGKVSATAAHAWNGNTVADAYISSPDLAPGVLAVGIDLNGGTARLGNGGTVVSTGYGVHFSPGAANTLTLSSGSVVSGGLASLYADPGARASVMIENSALSGVVAMRAAAASSTLTMTGSLVSVTNYSGSALIAFGGSVDVDASNILLIPTSFQTMALLDAGAVTQFAPSLSTLGGAYRVSHSADYATAWLSGFSQGGANANRAFSSFADYGTSSGLSSSQLAALGLEADRLSAEPYAAQAMAGMTLHRSLHDRAISQAFSSAGMTNASAAALGLTPDKAFGQGVLNAAMTHDLEQGADIGGGAGALGVSPAAGTGPGRGGATSRLFGGYLYSRYSQDNRGGYYGFDTNTSGVMMGVATDLSPRFTLAGYAAWDTGNTDYDGIDAAIETQGLHAGLIGRHTRPLTPTTDLRLTGNAAYSHFDNKAKRTILSQRTGGSYDQTIWSGGLEAALDYYPSGRDGLRLSPYGSMSYSWLDQSGLQEDGVAALAVEGKTAGQWNSALGVALAQDIVRTDGYVLTPAAALSWLHDFGDMDYSVNSRFLGSEERFTSRSVGQGRDGVYAGLSLDIVHRQDGREAPLAVKLGYGVERRTGSTGQTLYLGAKIRF